MDTNRSLTPVIPLHDAMAGLAHAADRASEQTTLARYRDRKAAHTLRRQAADIALFETFLNQAAESVSVANMAHDLAA